MKKTLQAREYIEMSFGFDKEQISLAIPTDGMTLKSGWKITPLYNPMVNNNHYLLDNEDAVKLTLAFHCEQIRKANVDHFESSQTIPKCELLVRWIHRDKPHDCLEHKIDIEGAKGCSYFTLYIPDEGERFS